MKKIVLASGSPRRCSLLQQMGADFVVKTADVDETIGTGHNQAEYWTVELAKRKAGAVIEKEHMQDGIVLAADTMVICENQILGKPVSDADARAKLRLLSGRAHEVVTGFYMKDLETCKEYAQAVKTKVFFRSLREEEIQAYIASGEGRDKAGGYGIQGLGALLVEKIDGCYFNVVGLPIASVYQGFRHLGINLLTKN